jgi:hypothetical protein
MTRESSEFYCLLPDLLNNYKINIKIRKCGVLNCQNAMYRAPPQIKINLYFVMLKFNNMMEIAETV